MDERRYGSDGQTASAPKATLRSAILQRFFTHGEVLGTDVRRSHARQGIVRVVANNTRWRRRIALKPSMLATASWTRHDHTVAQKNDAAAVEQEARRFHRRV